MSAGAFQIARYPASYTAGQIHPIRVQPETLALSITIGGSAVVNTQSGSTVNNPISAIVSRGKRARGLIPRTITIRFTGTPPTGYKASSPITLPALNAALIAAPAGATGTYLSAAVEVIGTSPERVR